MAEKQKKSVKSRVGHTQIERYFEVILYYVLFFVIVMSYLPMGVEMNHVVLNLMVFGGLVSGIVGYRFIPLEKKTGLIRFTFEQKNFLLGSADVAFVNVAVAASGAAYSPFYFIHLF